tara:strand:- start:69 stop:884 length:816 start_codon:yes stop_codon:yes gene_type:complete
VLSACSSLESIDIDNKASEVKPSTKQGPFCSDEWFHYVEGQINSVDNQGHGPDIGSLEWQSVVEFKLGLVNQPALPPKSTAKWCEYIQQALDERRIIPTLSCRSKTQNAIDKEICSQPALVILDNELSSVFKSVLEKLSIKKRTNLKIEQRNWINKRDQCLNHNDDRFCIRDAYQYRIAELQTRYDLIEGLGPIYYVCDGQLTDEVAVKFFPTVPPSLLAERNGQVSFMTQQKSASGARYQGQNEVFWEHQGKASITWGSSASVMDCKKMH